MSTAGKGRIDRVDFLTAVGNLPLQPAPLAFNVVELAQQLCVHLPPGALLAGSAALDIHALTLQGEQIGLGRGDQSFDLLYLPIVRPVQVSDAGIEPEQGFVCRALTLLLQLGITLGLLALPG